MPFLPLPRAMTALAVVAALSAATPGAAQIVDAPPQDIVNLWPGTPPGTPSDWTGPEFRGKESITNVTIPTLSVFRPAPGTATGAAMIVAPGGAFSGLAWNLEGREIAAWLTARGITAFVLKYRVHRSTKPVAPVRSGDDDAMPGFGVGEKLAMDDGLQAVKLVRRTAARYGIRPDRVGFIGFSAGAMTAMNVTLAGDAAGRPDLVVPVYGTMHPVPVPADAPPAFVVVARDDPIMGRRSIDIFDRWSAAGRPVELHVYEKGGHGFGMRPRGLPVDLWPGALEAWLRDRGWIGASATAGPAGG